MDERSPPLHIRFLVLPLRSGHIPVDGVSTKVFPANSWELLGSKSSFPFRSVISFPSFERYTHPNQFCFTI